MKLKIFPHIDKHLKGIFVCLFVFKFASRLAFFILLLAIIFGCSSGNRAEPIDLPSVALDIAMEKDKSGLTYESLDWMGDDWWRLFNDEQLGEFIQKAFVNNPSLQVTRANILLAASNAEKVRAALYPNIIYDFDIAREKLSKTGIVPFPTPGATGSPLLAAPFVSSTGPAAIPEYFTLYETYLSLTYEFDIWGKNRNTLRAALSEVQSDIADEAFSQLQIGIAVAQSYYQLQIDYKRQEIAKAQILNRNRYRDLVHQRVESSLVNALILSDADFNAAGTSQQLLQIQGDMAVVEHQLKAYMGNNFLEAIDDIKITERPLPQIPLPQDLPMHLLSHRPDITAQLWLIASAGKQIEVAKAGFYPDFNIIALFGFQTIHLHELFKWKSRYFNVNPAMTLPVFDGGRLEANLRGKEFNYDSAILQYNNLVITAVKEVLDGLAVLRISEKQFQEYKRQLEYQKNSLKLTKLRMEHNLDSELDYLVSENSMLVAYDLEIVGLGNLIQSILSLIKALGGGYDACYIEG